MAAGGQNATTIIINNHRHPPMMTVKSKEAEAQLTDDRPDSTKKKHLFEPHGRQNI